MFDQVDQLILLKITSTKDQKYIFPDRHHFDNPVYSTSYRGAHRGDGGAGGAGVAPAGAPIGAPSTHLPLNNGCSRVVNHFAPTCAAKKHVNIEREKLAAGGGTAPPNHYQDDIDTEEEEHESGKFNGDKIIVKWIP